MALGPWMPFIAFGAGLASFLAPCVLPVVPGYVSFIGGGLATSRLQRILRTVAFVSGFSVAFIALGLLVGALGQSATFQGYRAWAERIGGALIILFGLTMTGLLRLKFMERDLRYHGDARLQKTPILSAGLLGGAFAIGWSPCVGPILASILILASGSGTIASAGLLLSLYALGLAIPFLVVGIGADRGVQFLRRFQRISRGIEIGGGVLLIILGIFVFTGSINLLTSWIVPGGRNV